MSWDKAYYCPRYDRQQSDPSDAVLPDLQRNGNPKVWVRGISVYERDLNMNKETDIGKVRKTAEFLLWMEPMPTKYSPMIVQHPFTKSGMCMVKIEGEDQMINITASKENLQLWQKEMSEFLEHADLSMIYTFLNPSYGLVFLKYAEPYLSQRDFSEMLADIWILSENPNCDANVSKTDLRKMFREADPAVLMSEDERKMLSELDDIVIVYRGVTSHNSKNIRAMSWTLRQETAEWFAHRFGENGIVYEAQIDKKHIFAMFNGRNESEVIVDSRYLTGIEETEVPEMGMSLQ